MSFSKVFVFSALTIALAIPCGSAHGQSPRARISADYLFRPGTIALTLSGGGAAFTDFQQDPAIITTPGFPDGEPFVRRVSAQTTGTAAAALTVWLSKTVGMQVRGSYTPTRFRVTNVSTLSENDGPEASDTVRYAGLDQFIGDANVLLRPPMSFGRVAPYAILGGGLMHYRVRSGDAPVPPEAHDGFSGGTRTQVSGVAGVGAVIPLQRRQLLLSFDITDHVTRSPISGGGQTASFESDGRQIELRPKGSDSGTDGIVVTSHLQLTVGVTIPLRLR